ncbi:type II toxin-antitoxin system RelE/ParE family toxin [Rhizobium sp. CF080]|uniref:type II toxin-antitoxin system RelE/ParE family toxin n=1 Tax=Rhizobium sp. (strain CF080) TaxID=1144310 RepID=UPI0018CC4A73|nr:type II toxin-antitoxin system RelE/ParE family toxin [Rhizobium sp. CF080]
MGQISRRPQFIEDLREVWDFIAKDSQDQADAFILQLEKRYQNLADNPHLGVRRFPKYPTMRMFPFRKYIIIYHPFADGSGVELIRLLHAARDYHRYFDD